MCQKLLGDPRFFEFLYRCDQDYLERARKQGCRRCQGRLHRADYARKPRGALQKLGREYSQRLSLCCGRPGCRKRETPPSVRYLGPKVYLGAVIVLCMAMQHGVTPRRAAELKRAVGVSRPTLCRWQKFWQQLFVQTRFWQQARSYFMPPVTEAELPGSLLSRFCGELPAQLGRLLQFVAPLTTSSAGGWM